MKFKAAAPRGKDVRELVEEIQRAYERDLPTKGFELTDLTEWTEVKLHAFLAEREEDDDATEGIGWPAAMDAPISPRNVDGVGRTLAEWQDAIRSYATERSGAPEHLIDGSGTDSGDPLDLTLAEVGQAIVYVEERAEEAEAELHRALGEGAGLRRVLSRALTRVHESSSIREEIRSALAASSLAKLAGEVLEAVESLRQEAVLEQKRRLEKGQISKEAAFAIEAVLDAGEALRAELAREGGSDDR